MLEHTLTVTLSFSFCILIQCWWKVVGWHPWRCLFNPFTRQDRRVTGSSANPFYYCVFASKGETVLKQPCAGRVMWKPLSPQSAHGRIHCVVYSFF